MKATNSWASLTLFCGNNSKAEFYLTDYRLFFLSTVVNSQYEKREQFSVIQFVGKVKENWKTNFFPQLTPFFFDLYHIFFVFDYSVLSFELYSKKREHRYSEDSVNSLPVDISNFLFGLNNWHNAFGKKF